MKGIVLDQPNQFRAASDLPEIADLPAGYARVRTKRVGICGTDWHAIAGRQPFFNYPRILGHELGVEVVEVNDPDGLVIGSSLKPGDRCSVEPYMNCGHCIACRRGKGNCCTTLQCLGVHADGGMREEFVLPARKLHKSDKLTFDQLALVETLAIGCHAVARANLEKGERVLVLGAGPIGLSVIPFVQAQGAEPIVADVSESRLEFCRKQMKVKQTVDARGDVVAALRSMLGDELPTCVIDATGNPQSMMSTFERMAPGGRIVFVGLFVGDVTFNDPNFHRRETTLMGSRNALPGDFTRIIKLIEDGVIDTTPWITHRTSAANFVDILPSWQKPEAAVLKAIVEF